VRGAGAEMIGGFAEALSNKGVMVLLRPKIQQGEAVSLENCDVGYDVHRQAYRKMYCQWSKILYDVKLN
jgi:hypothetical protein